MTIKLLFGVYWLDILPKPKACVPIPTVFDHSQQQYTFFHRVDRVAPHLPLGSAI